MVKEMYQYTKAASFYILAKKYNAAALNLYEQRGKFGYVFEPSYALIAHSFELNLKAMGLITDANFNSKEFGHRIKKLFIQLNKEKWSQGVFQQAENFANSNIKKIARRNRDEDLVSVLDFFDLDQASNELLNQLGFPTDDHISKLNFTLADIIDWFADHVEKDGNQFRYPKNRMTRLITISGGEARKTDIVEFIFLSSVNDKIFHECAAKASSHRP